MAKIYNVYKRREGPHPIVTQVGVVSADNQVQADTRARTLFGHKAWTKEREAA